MKKTKLILLAILNLIGFTIYAQDGTLDATFGVGGKVTTDLGLESLYKIAIQSDGKIVAVGSYNNGTNLDFGIARYKTNGTLDSTFSGDGIQYVDFNTSEDVAYDVSILSDGKILAVGYTYKSSVNLNDFAFAKFNSDGSLDNTFGTSGKVMLDIDDDIALSIKVETSGKFYIASTGDADNSFTLLRFNSNGSIDLTFNTVGYTQTNLSTISSENISVSKLLVQNDGKILLCGTESSGSGTQKGIFVRYNSNGVQDSTYGKNGIVFLGDKFSATSSYFVLNSILIENNSIISAMTISGRLAIMKMDNKGKIDSSFGLNGISRLKSGNSYGSDLIRESSGKIIVVGYYGNVNSSNNIICRFKVNGDIDSSFSNDGFDTLRVLNIIESGMSVALQSDGKIIMGSKSTNISNNGSYVLARYNSTPIKTGILDFTSSQKSIMVSPNPIESNAVVEYSLDTDIDQLSMSLYDMQGKKLKTYMSGQSKTKGDHTENITLPEGLESGNYILQISSPKGNMNVQIAH